MMQSGFIRFVLPPRSWRAGGTCCRISTHSHDKKVRKACSGGSGPYVACHSVHDTRATCEGFEKRLSGWHELFSVSDLLRACPTEALSVTFW
jgi:hypothetical protein